ncbi:hypothetical protein TRIUR3_32753 [Triticum urartu]|uniref:Uncharacterized protein n=1 Tax=Triticum urartu TaxID=4572 RepID=M7ZIN8_TRIUA|nr:hypothetical protein TRIUR3_32753 [Triticum urartu]
MAAILGSSTAPDNDDRERRGQQRCSKAWQKQRLQAAEANPSRSDSRRGSLEARQQATATHSRHQWRIQDEIGGWAQRLSREE